MPVSLKGRSLLTLKDYTQTEVSSLINSAIEFKRLKRAGVYPKNLDNKNIALIFLKPSCRTRMAFVVAASDEGAHLEIIPHEDIRFGIKESVQDIARVLGRMFDGIAFRGFDFGMLRELAQNAGVPVWNCLCDLYHPTQVLADLMTIQEEFGQLAGIKMAYVGDGRNNMARSLAIGCSIMGIDLRIIAPEELQPPSSLIAEAKDTYSGARGSILATDHLEEGLNGCDVVYGDVWVSMGEEALVEARINLLREYKVTEEIINLTNKPTTIYLHCLPALHNLKTEFSKAHPNILEVSDGVFESFQSRVFDQAENRMHTAKAIMVETI